MGFILKEPNTFINIKLTDTGRKMMALGSFNMSKVLLLDREIDYTIDNDNSYNIFDNRVIDPPDFYPDSTPFNLDGSAAFALGAPQITTVKQIVTATTSQVGLVLGGAKAWTLYLSQALGKNRFYYSANTSYSQTIVLDDPGSFFPEVGNLVFIPWVDNISNTSYYASQVIPPAQPVLCLWYRIISAQTPNIVLDRPIPTLGSASRTSCYYYPFNGIENNYGTGTTITTQPWNLNIVRTKSVIGTNVSLNVSGATEFNYYGSLEYAGTKHYFGFGNETPAVGFIHYTNENTGNTYGEQLLEKSIIFSLPYIMWHHTGENNNIGTMWGQTFYDEYGKTSYDPFARTSYRDLKDGKSITAITVGRVYHKLKMIVITDQELLNIMTYKSNRNYSLPDFSLSFSDLPKTPLSISQTNGLCKSGYTYFVTYLPASGTYAASSSFGHPDAIPCGYIKKINGEMDESGNPKFLQIDFPNPNSFPYMRSSSSWDTYGWAAKTLQILINEQPSELNYDIATVPNSDWKILSSGNGMYNCVTYGDTSIDGQKLNSHSFIISQEDFNSGNTYNLSTGITINLQSLNFGDESFMYGNMNASILSTSYKTSIMITAADDTMNSSVNPTYNGSNHEEVYITEVAILDDHNQVVAAGKPTYPVKKRNGRYIAFQLEIDF